MKSINFDSIAGALSGLATVALLAAAPAALADHDDWNSHSSKHHATGLVKKVLDGTRQFRNPSVADGAGWNIRTGCVSGPDEGAMGIHFVNGGLLFDGALDAESPEALMYEVTGNSRLRLVGVEFIAIAENWNAAHGDPPLGAPPVLFGQHFHYTGSPNRYGLPPFYSLHVWAWRDNPHGMFVNWNPRVSCEKYTTDAP